MGDVKENSKNKVLVNYVVTCVKIIGIVICLYLFICSLDILSSAFKLLAGKATGKKGIHSFSLLEANHS